MLPCSLTLNPSEFEMQLHPSGIGVGLNSTVGASLSNRGPLPSGTVSARLEWEGVRMQKDEVGLSHFELRAEAPFVERISGCAIANSKLCLGPAAHYRDPANSKLIY